MNSELVRQVLTGASQHCERFQEAENLEQAPAPRTRLQATLCKNCKYNAGIASKLVKLPSRHIRVCANNFYGILSSYAATTRVRRPMISYLRHGALPPSTNK